MSPRAFFLLQVNSDAEDNPESPIAGMPVLKVWEAGKVIAFKARTARTCIFPPRTHATIWLRRASNVFLLAIG
jgi:hypothetical protein